MTEVVVEEISGLDFDYEPPCEHSTHRGSEPPPALVIVRVSCDWCGKTPHILYLCGFCWGWKMLRCHSCGMRGVRERFWTFLGYVKGSK